MSQNWGNMQQEHEKDTKIKSRKFRNNKHEPETNKQKTNAINSKTKNMSQKD